MTLSQRITRATTKQFLATKYFSESIKFFPGGETPATTFNGVWDASGLEGRNQIEGEGSNLEVAGGRRVRQSIFLEVPASLDVNEERDHPDMFKRVSDGETVYLKRIAGTDNDSKTLECVRTLQIMARKPSRRG
jgi:hypothetical protein